MFGVRLPSFIYESMPYIYAVTGVISIYNILSPLSFIGGALFILVGVYIYKMRRFYRG